MRVVRFGTPGQERPGLWRDGGLVDLWSHFPDMPDIGPAFFAEGWLSRLAGLEVSHLSPAYRLGPPIMPPGKIICLGKNYAEHASEGGFDLPEAPLLFCKAPTAVTGPTDPIRLPLSSGQVDWEVELALVIGRQCKRLAPADALDAVAGVMVMNDVSARQAQFGDGQWFRGKSFDTFAPMGPALVTLDEIARLDHLTLTAHVNDQLMQTGTTRDLIFDLPAILAYVSRDITLMPGDVISTGTPAGVGIFRNPPITLSAGDRVVCEITGIGRLDNPVVGPELEESYTGI
jgi:2,4-didehydro-3-deoxy-L-rhamnonate hydrolase